MDRRTFLAKAGAAAILPLMPATAQPAMGIDLAPLPDETVVRLLGIQNGAIREVHRVIGIPRYQMGRDTWQDQVDAGLSRIVGKSRHSVEAD